MSEMEKIKGVRQALQPAQEIINKRTQDKVIKINSHHNKRHYVLTTEKGLTYYLLYKRAYFMSFGRMFNLKGIGESINRERLAFCLNNKIDNIIVIHQEGYVYVCNPREWFDFATRHQTIRTTNTTREKTYSIPVMMLRRWK